MKHKTTIIDDNPEIFLQPIMRVNTTFVKEVKLYVYNKYQVAYGIRYLTTYNQSSKFTDIHT